MTDQDAPGGGELRQRFVDAALEILREPDTSLDLRKVAERAGKSRTAPYLAFGKTEEGGGLPALQLSVASEGFRMLDRRMEEALQSAHDPEEGLRGLATAYLAFARDEPRLFRLMFGPDVGHALGQPAPSGPGRRERSALREARAGMERVLHRAIGRENRGYLRRHGSLDPADLSGAVWAMLHGVAMLTIDAQWETTRLGRLDDPAALASRTLRFLTTASSEEMRPAEEALMEARMEKGLEPDVAWLREAAPEPALDLLSDASPERDLEVLCDASPELCDPGGEPHEPDTVLRRAPPPEPARLEVEGAVRSSGDLSGLRLSGPRPPGDSAIRRARGLAHLAEGVRVLWIDDIPQRSSHEAAALTALGMEISRALGALEALVRLEEGPFDLIISDIARGDSPDEGIRTLPQLLEASPGVPVIFYVGTLRQDLGAPPGAFGITSDPDELVHLVFDALERGRG